MACVRDYREKGAGKRAQENPLPDLLRCGLKSLISFHFISFLLVYSDLQF